MTYSLFQVFVFDIDLIVHNIPSPQKNISHSQPQAGYTIYYTLYHNNPLKRRWPTTNEKK